MGETGIWLDEKGISNMQMIAFTNVEFHQHQINKDRFEVKSKPLQDREYYPPILKNHDSILYTHELIII